MWKIDGSQLQKQDSEVLFSGDLRKNDGDQLRLVDGFCYMCNARVSTLPNDLHSHDQSVDEYRHEVVK
ncbi:hypothetical protein L0156_30315 [bacterium]|nr:hypothetical protein [bacterium]